MPERLGYLRLVGLEEWATLIQNLNDPTKALEVNGRSLTLASIVAVSRFVLMSCWDVKSANANSDMVPRFGLTMQLRVAWPKAYTV